MFLLQLFVPTSIASTLTVGATGTYAGIQDAVDAAASGDTITIEAGTYAECVDLGGRDLRLIGAGSGGTFLDGGGACAAALTAELGETAQLSGLSISNGAKRAVSLASGSFRLVDVRVTDSGNTADPGGGLYVSGGSVELEDCVLSGNTASKGGNLYLAGADAVLTDTEVSDGTASSGGGIYLDSDAGVAPSITVLTSLISGNSASSAGGLYADSWSTVVSEGSDWRENTNSSGAGGAILMGGSTTLSSTDDTFSDNGGSSSTGGVTGGAVYSSGASVDFVRATFSSNVARTGGAALLYNGCVASFTDSSFEENSSGSAGGAVYASTNVVLSVVGSTFSGNESGPTTSGAGGAI